VAKKEEVKKVVKEEEVGKWSRQSLCWSKNRTYSHKQTQN